MTYLEFILLDLRLQRRDFTSHLFSLSLLPCFISFPCPGADSCICTGFRSQMSQLCDSQIDGVEMRLNLNSPDCADEAE
jgi:hypothetical protein